MNSTLLFTSIFAVPGLLILMKKQYPPFPLGKTRVITGRDARAVGIAMIIPAVVGVIGFAILKMLSQSERTIDNLALIVNVLLVFISVVYTGMTTLGARRSENKTPKESQLLPKMLSVREAANYLEVDEADIRNLIKDGDLKAKAVNGDYHISKEALEVIAHP